MSAIRDFFKKKKTDAKFKIAGGGHKLGDASTAAAASSAAAAAARRTKPAERSHPSTSAQQAGAAALNRISGQQQPNDSDLARNRQKAKIREQARRELEQEQKIQQEVDKIKQVYGDHEPEVKEGPGQLAAQGVFFKCPLVGEEVYPRDIMKLKIKEFLYSQLEHERGLTAVLIIHTCNSPRDRVQLGIDTLEKYIGNILAHPGEEKYMKIRRSNKAFQERVAGLEGTEEFLLDAGFQVKQLPGQTGEEEEFWVLDPAVDMERLAMLQDSLKSCEPLTAELDRGLVIIPPGSGGSGNVGIGALPPDFFSLSSEEVKKEHQSKSDLAEREAMLRTKAMRDKESGVGRRKYKYCLIRVRFSDGYMLQGTFGVREELSAVFEFITENLETPLPFHILDSVTGARLDNAAASLQDLQLVPASIVNFCWDPEIEADLAAAGSSALPFLKSSLLYP